MAKQIGRNILKIREKKGISRAELIKKLEAKKKKKEFDVEMIYQWLYRVEEGHRNIDKPAHIAVVADCLGVPVDELMRGV